MATPLKFRGFNGCDYPIVNKPTINFNHIDGPLLTCRDGTPHWLTLSERIWLRMGLTTIELLDKKHNMEDCRGA